jgi:hypothetical protein
VLSEGDFKVVKEAPLEYATDEMKSACEKYFKYAFAESN